MLFEVVPGAFLGPLFINPLDVAGAPVATRVGPQNDRVRGIVNIANRLDQEHGLSLNALVGHGLLGSPVLSRLQGLEASDSLDPRIVLILVLEGLEIHVQCAIR